MNRVTVIGAGLAGCEAAWQLAEAGISVDLCEMKPLKFSPAHSYKGLAELVCSNSLKASRVDSAAGLLKEEMRILGSLLVPCAQQTAVAAGGALAVDREAFSDLVTAKITAHELINLHIGELEAIPEGNVIIATGPLTAGGLAKNIEEICGGYLSFFDAAAPIVTAESLDNARVFFASRYGKGEDDYINCPMNREEYAVFYNALITAEGAPLSTFDSTDFKVYEGCMPIEVLGKRGEDTMRFGPLKPVGLIDPHTDRRPYAVVQLRKENAQGSLYNLVGFQTNLKFGEQKRVFSLIPGLENAEFARYGVMHRNSFIDSPRLLNSDYSLKSNINIYFAGQITGVEGYMESAGSGLLAGKNMARKLTGKASLILPRETMLGALGSYISDSSVTNFQPMGSNMGILPSLAEGTLQGKKPDKKLKYAALADRAVVALREYLEVAL